jgi:hypothetical protein
LTSEKEHLILSAYRNSFYHEVQPETVQWLKTGPLRRGGIMSDFNVTDLAVKKLKEYMEQNNIDSALRVALMQGG